MFEKIDFLKKGLLIELFIALLVLELFVFSDVLMPIQWGRIKINGQIHSGPNAELVGGKLYLKWSMPDSLRQLHIDLSQIQLVEPPYSDSDPMGVDAYLVRGRITGTFRESSNSKIYLQFKVESFSLIHPIYKILVLVFFYLQMVFFIVSLLKSSNKNISS